MLKTIPEAAVPSERVLKTLSTFAVDMLESLPELKHDLGLSYLFIHNASNCVYYCFTVQEICHSFKCNGSSK